MKREENLLKIWEKPSDPETVLTIQEAEGWRSRLSEKLRDNLNRLYNEPLPEAETKYLNDKVNEQIKELRRWETRIVELGGIDYSRDGISAPDGDILNSKTNNYQYFGRARELPIVKELIEAEKKRMNHNESNFQKKLNKDELLQKVDAEYYGLYENNELDEQETLMENERGLPSEKEPIIELLC